ncbi:hypothetical protein C0Q70_18703 [Pomacea canaliculata]|uniref:Uncharacterized protein n=1 Tax=Pomacea canaliculata TaxID=400727 RepID=A0A2T7NH90_POMCA|nr:hypothetical protein C0Q70_18703 [Pomacea canaliculata]
MGDKRPLSIPIRASDTIEPSRPQSVVKATVAERSKADHCQPHLRILRTWLYLVHSCRHAEFLRGRGAASNLGTRQLILACRSHAQPTSPAPRDSRVTEEFKGLKEVRDLSLEPSNSHFGRAGYRTYSHLRSLALLTSPISCGLISQARKRPHYPANFLPSSLDRLGLSPACLHHDMAHLIQGRCVLGVEGEGGFGRHGSAPWSLRLNPPSNQKGGSDGEIGRAPVELEASTCGVRQWQPDMEGR